MHGLGYTRLFTVGERLNSGFTVWRREDSLRHVIAVEDEELTEYLYVQATPDLRDISSRWASLVRDVAITEFLREITRSERSLAAWEGDIVASIARRVTEGTRQRYVGPNT
jgi:hypothetical protein